MGGRKLYLSAIWLLLGLCTSLTLCAQSASPTEGCSPLVVNFTGNGSWDFDDGSPPIAATDPARIFTNPGQYAVTLNGSLVDTITVFQNPTADYTNVGDTAGCSPHTVSFTDASTPGDGPIVNWQWNFGDGNNSSDQNPTHTWNTSDSFNVTLIITDTNGCTDVIQKIDHVIVSESPVVGFSGTPTGACGPPLLVSFTNSTTYGGSSPPVTYAWDFGDGGSSNAFAPSYSYNNTGTYTVSLIATDGAGCSDTLIRPNYIGVDSIVADFTGPTSACEGAGLTFFDASTGGAVNFQWDFGDGTTSTATNPAKVYNTPGTYTVSLIATNGDGCPDTIVRNNYITIHPEPVANFSPDVTNACQPPLSVSFTDLSTVSSGAITGWNWDFGDGNTSTLQNPTNVYAAAGTYSVRLTVTTDQGCTDQFIFNSIVIQPPNAAFNANPRDGCAPLDVNFNNNSSSADPITGYFWDFGDGNTSTASDPVHTYNDTGRFTVTLIVTTAGGCMDTLVRNNYIEAGDTPIVNFIATPDSVCAEDPVNFTDLSNIGDEWLWDFGDGGSSTQQNPTYNYQDTGCFDVNLLVRHYGCENDTTITDVVCVLPPIAIFTLNPAIGCAVPHTVFFTDQSIVTDPARAHWDWDFGDGNSSTAQNPVHSYTSTGNFTVTLTVYDSITMCDHEATAAVSVSTPTADFTGAALFGCGPFTVNFTNLSTGATSYLWDFGDGNTSTAVNPSHTYDTPGVYTVTLTVTDGNGCTDTRTRTNYVQVIGPNVNFGADSTNGCVDFTVNFTDSTIFSAPITGWSWDFGDGTGSMMQNPTKTYDSAGVYTVTLIVSDIDGCFDTFTRVNYIDASRPVALFTVSDTFACPDFPISFTNLSSGNSLSYLWLFGDGDSSTAQNPLHSYSDTGLYDVTLTVTDANGCDSTISFPGLIRVSRPTANFGADPTGATCPPLNVNFTDSSSSDVVGWEWDFGDGSGSFLQNPTNIYAYGDTFDVQLIVTSNTGCRDTLFVPELIKLAGPRGSFTFDPDSSCFPITVTFRATAEGTTLYQWDFGNGVLSSQLPYDTIQYTYPAPGTYSPELILYSSPTCSIGVFSPDTVVIHPVPDPGFTADTVCLGEQTTFTDTTNFTLANPTYSWDFESDGVIDTVTVSGDIAYQYPSAGSFTATLIVANIFGCADTFVNDVFVRTPPTADFSPDVVCLGFATRFTDLSTTTPSSVYQWDFDNNGSIDLTTSGGDTINTYGSSGPYDIFLRVTDQFGCRDSTVVGTFVNARPAVSLTADTVCRDYLTTFDGTVSTTQNSTFQWDFENDGSIDLTSFDEDTTHAYGTDGSFTAKLIVTDSLSCQDSATGPVRVLGPPQAVVNVDSVCTGNSNTFNVASSISPPGSVYEWDWEFDGTVDLTTGNFNQSRNFGSAGAYTTLLVISDPQGCVDSALVPVYVVANPVPSFVADTSCLGDSTLLQSTSVFDSATSLFTYEWDYTNDGPFDFTTNVDSHRHIYAVTGTNTTRLRVTDNFGCFALVTGPVYVRDLPQASFTSDTVCFGDSTTFQVNSSFPDPLSVGDRMEWDVFPNGPLDALTGIVDSLRLRISAQGTIPLNLTVFDSAGCSSSYLDSFYVYRRPSALFTSDTVCEGQATTHTSTATFDPNASSFTYFWGWGGGGSDSFAIPTAVHTYPGSGVFSTIHRVRDNLGCERQTTGTVYVRNGPGVSFTTDSVCLGSYTLFTVADTFDQFASSATYEWDWENDAITDSTNNGGNISHRYSSSGTRNARLRVTDDQGCIGQFIGPVYVRNPPVANFEVDTICEGFASPFRDLSSFPDPLVSGGTYEWDFDDDGTTDLTTNGGDTINTYPAGTHAAFLRIIDVHGCADSFQRSDIYVRINPIVSAEADSACLGDPTTFTVTDSLDVSSGSPLYSWDFGDGIGMSTVGVPTTTYTYLVSGLDTATVIVTDDNGCVGQASTPAYVVANPVPSFTSDTVCLGENTLLRSTSVFDPATFLYTYDWDYTNNGSFDFTTNVDSHFHIYATAGTNTTRMRVTDNFGCFAQTTAPVYVRDLPVATFTADTVCFGDTTLFRVSSSFPDPLSSGDRLEWDVFPNGPLDALTGIVDSLGLRVSAQGTIPLNLTVYDDAGCSSSYLDSFYIRRRPSVTFTADTVCEGQATTHSSISTFDTLVSSVTYFWIWGGGGNDSFFVPTAVHTYPSSGQFSTVHLVRDNFGCERRTTQQVYVRAEPGIGFTTDSVCLGNPTNFTVNDTFDALVSSAVYEWDWENDAIVDSTNNGGNLSHQYPTAGTRTARLRVTDEYGCNGQVTAPVYVRNLPVANFEVDTVCEGIASPFRDLSSFPDPLVNGGSYEWDFDDNGSTDLTTNGGDTVNTYPAGTHAAFLRITDAHGCADSFSRADIYVRTGPQSSFVSDSVCIGQPTNFSVTDTLGPTASSLVYDWDFGDGSGTATVLVPTVSYTYLAAGTDTAVLQVIDDNGCRDTVSGPVYVRELPNVVFSADTVCEDDTTSFTNNTTLDPQASSAVYNWDFQTDGSVDLSNSGGDVRFHYNSGGTFNASLSVSDVQGCSNADTIPVYVSTPPIIGINTDTVCRGDSTSFSIVLLSIDPLAVSDTNYFWYYDGVTDSSRDVQQFAYAYPAAGTDSVSLLIVDGFGCRDTVSDPTVYVRELPVLTINTDTVCREDPSSLYLESLLLDPLSGADTTYTWYYDGSTDAVSNSDSITYIYPNAGTDSVSLLLSDEFGCSGLAIDTTLYVRQLPVVSFISDTVCRGVATTFNDSLQTDPLVGSTKYEWDFDAEAQASGPASDTSYVFADSGLQQVRLVAIDEFGCRDTFDDRTYVVEPPQLGPAVADSVCAGDSSNLSVGSLLDPINPGAGYSWELGYGNTDSTLVPSLVHRFDSSGTQFIRVIATDAYACMDTLDFNAYLRRFPQATPVADSVCLDFQSTLSVSMQIDSLVDSVSLNWRFGDGAQFTEIAAADGPVSLTDSTGYIYASAGTFNASLVYLDDAGCGDTVDFPVYVRQDPTFDPTVTDNCLNEFTPFSGTYLLDPLAAPSQTFLRWDYETDGVVDTVYSDTVPGMGYEYPAPGIYTLTLYIRDNQTCEDTVTTQLEIFPLPEPDFVNDTVCFDDPGGITFVNQSQTTPVAEYRWDFQDDGLVDTAINTTSLTAYNVRNRYTSGGTYQVRLSITDSNSCEADTVKTVFQPVPNTLVDTIVEPVRCHNEMNGSIAIIPAGDYLPWTYAWSNGATDSAISGLDTGTYQLVITDGLGCLDTFDIPITQPDPLDLDSLPTDLLCNRANGGLPIGSVELSATGGNQPYQNYIWSTGDTGIGIFDLFPGSYSATVIDAKGCRDSITAVVREPDTLKFDLLDRYILQYGEEIQIVPLQMEGFGNLQVQWYPSNTLSCALCDAPFTRALDNVLYYATLFNENGCEVTDQTTIAVTKPAAIAPTGFSPNGDGENDFFRVYTSDNELVAESWVRVYNRWGEKLWEGTVNDAWDGTFKGREQEVGVYVYLAWVRFETGQEELLEGNVTLLR